MIKLQFWGDIVPVTAALRRIFHALSRAGLEMFWYGLRQMRNGEHLTFANIRSRRQDRQTEVQPQAQLP